MSTPKPKKTLADLASKYDRSVAIPKQINAALEALVKSGDDYTYEKEFSELVSPKISLLYLAQYRDQFEDFWAEVRDIGTKTATRRVWFASKALCKKWKEQVRG
jgi:hypothetical protein